MRSPPQTTRNPEREVQQERLPERVIPGLFYASGGRRLRRVTYRSLAAESDLGEISEAMATQTSRPWSKRTCS
jgi:hypothetical protein